MSEEKKAMGPRRLPVGTHLVRLTGAEVKKGVNNPDSEILHISLSKVLPNGDVDEAFKPIKEWVGVSHPSEKYIEISTKKVDALLKLMGVEEGLERFGGNLGIMSTKEFKKEFSFEEFEIEVYESDNEETFTPPGGTLVTFKRHLISLK